MSFKQLAFALAIVSGCMVYGITSNDANALDIDWSGCGAGSMCTNDGYICTPKKTE